jgi:hypothetical protein
MSKKQETNASDDENLNNRKEPEMANETIEDIVRDVRHVSELHGMSYKDDKNWHLTIHNYTRILADRIEAAHKREIIVERNLGTDEIDMAVAAKDATIARLTEVLKQIAMRPATDEVIKKIAMRQDTDFVSEFEANVDTALAALATEGGAK